MLAHCVRIIQGFATLYPIPTRLKESSVYILNARFRESSLLMGVGRGAAAWSSSATRFSIKFILNSLKILFGFLFEKSMISMSNISARSLWLLQHQVRTLALICCNFEAFFQFDFEQCRFCIYPTFVNNMGELVNLWSRLDSAHCMCEWILGWTSDNQDKDFRPIQAPVMYLLWLIFADRWTRGGFA